MRVIIYAAGVSRRLSSIASDGLKGLLEFKGKKIIEHQLDWITKLDIIDVIIVIGLEHERYVKHLGDSYNGVPIKYIYNPDYKDKGNMLSLWHAREFCDTDVLFTTSDLICNLDDIQLFTKSSNENKILVDSKSVELYEDPDPVKVCINNNHIVGLRKKNSELDSVDGLAIGIYQFSKAGIMAIIKAIENKLEHGLDNLSLYYAIDDVLSSQNTRPVIMKNSSWFDVDTPNDLYRAENEY